MAKVVVAYGKLFGSIGFVAVVALQNFGYGATRPSPGAFGVRSEPRYGGK